MITTIEKDCLIHKTVSNEFFVESFVTYLQKEAVLVEYKKLSDICMEGCKNFNKKYSCPPLSPPFNLLARNYQYLVVNAIKIKLSDYQKIFNTIRMTNSVGKSLQRKIIENAFTDRQLILSNGSCRLCKICAYQDNLPCKYPGRMRYSLEATGVNVNELTIKCFEFPLVWYQSDNFPEYHCVVSGVLTNEPESVVNRIVKSFKTYKYQNS
ncbi:MAG: DUF2284 domain-containing protein [Cyanobacteriota bacterium]